MSNYCPPPVLVKTWLMLINLSSEEDARKHAKRMINRNFGSVDLAFDYLEQSPGESYGGNILVKSGM